MIFFYQFLFLVFAYLISSIPFGLVLVKKYRQIDIRQHGSKNIGATNVMRLAGKKLAFLTLILDGFKGSMMIIIARFVFFDVNNLHLFLVIIGAVCVLGHIYSVYLNFKGGKGVATAIAVLLALDFAVGMLAICFWIMSFCAFRISSVSSLIAIFSTVILSSAYGAPTSQIIFCLALFILIFVRHRENILRIMTGEENKFKK
jgi:glycerol-3-phosphate acyltransferase PlsY